MSETESAYTEAVAKIFKLSNAELDFELEQTATLNEKTEMLLCCYLAAVRERRVFDDFGYPNIYDYAFARFSFGEPKTRYLVSLGQKIDWLPKITSSILRRIPAACTPRPHPVVFDPGGRRR